MKKFLSIVLLIGWMLVIFLFSNSPGKDSTETSSRVITTFIEIRDNITNNSTSELDRTIIIENLSFIVRKFAHISEYIILAILMYNVLYNYNIKDYWIVLLLCILYSCSDEFHQLFVPGRSGQVVDVLIDSIGIVIGTLSYYLVKIK